MIDSAALAADRDVEVPKLADGARDHLEDLVRLAGRLTDSAAAVVRAVEPAGLATRAAWGAATQRTGSDSAAWSSALEAAATVVVGDGRGETRFAGDSLVDDGFCAWIMVPVQGSAGAVVGVIAVLDRSPRAWTEKERDVVGELAAAAGRELERTAAQVEQTRYRELVEELDAIAWEFDLASWRFTFVNQRAEAILGYPVERWLNEPGFWENRVLHPDDRDWALDYCEAATRERRDHEFDYRAVRADGSIVWLKDRVRVVLDGDGQPYRIRGVMTEITGERLAADALRHSEEKFRQLAENVSETFWIFDAQFTETIYVSPAHADLWGSSVESLYEDPQSFVAAVHPEDQPRLREAMAVVARERFDGVEYRVIRPDGEVRWAFSRGYPVRDEDGRVYRVVGTTEDVTERKLAQDRLAAAEAHYRMLVENAPYAIYALDANGCFVELNPAGEAVLECGPGAALGKHFSTVIAPESLDVATRGFEQVLSGEADHIEFDEWVLQASGGKRLIRVSESAIFEGGVIVGTHGVGRDITDEYEMDRQLRRAERLASIGTLIGGVAHELNNPLQSIRSFTSLLLESAEPGEDTEDLKTIQRESQRASRIVSNLRLLARQAQDEPGERAPLDLNDVVRHVLKTRRYALDTASIEVVEDLFAELPAVLGDRGQLEQVVLNLVVNAEHAVEGAAVRRIALTTRPDDDAVALVVSDSGVGIHPDHVDHVFDPFFTTKAPGEGTGLGLSLVYGIVTEHGGAVHVDSEPAKGTTLRLRLPAAAANDGATEATEHRSEPRRPLRVLVVDDEPAIRSALRRYLSRSRGHSVDEAADGEEALGILEAADAAYDVILSDLRMPGLSGDELLSRLEALGTGLEQRVIFLTGDAASGHAARVLAAADVPVLFKPIELGEVADQLERRVEELAGRVWRSIPARPAARRTGPRTTRAGG
jgi:PAS domain S-box-containing protein